MLADLELSKLNFGLFIAKKGQEKFWPFFV